MNQYNKLLETYEYQLNINENKLKEETIKFNNCQISYKLDEINKYDIEKNHQENLNNILEICKKNISEIEKEIFFLETNKNNYNLNIEINDQPSFVLEINSLEKTIYDLEFEKKKNLKTIQDLSEEKNSIQPQILTEIKDTENLKIKQNEISKNNILEYKKKLIDLEDQLKLNFKKIKEKKINPCNYNNDLLKILKTKIQKRSNLNKNKESLGDLENNIKDLQLKFIVEAEKIKESQKNRLTETEESITNVKSEIEILEYQYLEIDKKKTEFGNNIKNLLKKNKTDYIKKIINKNNNKLNNLDNEQLLLSKNITEKYNDLKVQTQSITDINHECKKNIKKLSEQKEANIKELQGEKRKILNDNKDIILKNKNFKNTIIEKKTKNTNVVKQQELYSNIDTLNIQVNKINNKQNKNNDLFNRNMEYLKKELEFKITDIQNGIDLIISKNSKIDKDVGIIKDKILELDIKRSDFLSKKNNYEIEKTKNLFRLEELYKKREDLHSKLQKIKEQINKDSQSIGEKRNKRNNNSTNNKIKSNLKIISYQNKIRELKDHIYKLKKLVL